MEEALIKRVLPHSIEGEQSVIGSMLMDREAIITASEIISAEDFYQHQYGIMFEAMIELFNENKPVDFITLQNKLKEKELPPEISSLEYINDLVAAVPTSANVRYYADIVKDKAMLRRLIKVTRIWRRYLQIRRKTYFRFSRARTEGNLCLSARLSSMRWNGLRRLPESRET